MMNNEDKKIKDALMKNTNDIENLKSSIWDNIEKEINKIDNKENDLNIKDKSKINFTKYSSVAAVLVIGVIAATSYGEATINNIKKMFEPNKEVVQKIEGNNETISMTLSENTTMMATESTTMMTTENVANYLIYYDKNMYTMNSLQGKDVITPIDKAEGYPEVSMTIEQITDKDPSIVATEIKKDIEDKYKIAENKGLIDEPVLAILIKAKTGFNSKDAVANYYLIDNNKGGTFKITQKYFIEAAEGHGARFYNMLKEFKITND